MVLQKAPQKDSSRCVVEITVLPYSKVSQAAFHNRLALDCQTDQTIKSAILVDFIRKGEEK